MGERTLTPSAGLLVDLVCIDVDGTLIGSAGTVSDAVWEAAERARSAGVRLALSSGRPGFGTAVDYAARLDPTGWHVFQNGASIMNLATGESRSHSFPREVLEWLVRRAAETGRVLEVYTDHDYAQSEDRRSVQHAELLGLPFRPRVPLALTEPVVRAQWLVPPADVERVLAEPHPDLTLSASTSPLMPDTTFINMTAPGADKGSAVQALAEAYGFPLERVMFVGDGSNDVGAMRRVGVPVAMANAEAEVLEAARFTVPHVDEDGLIDALRMAMGEQV